MFVVQVREFESGHDPVNALECLINYANVLNCSGIQLATVKSIIQKGKKQTL